MAIFKALTPDPEQYKDPDMTTNLSPSEQQECELILLATEETFPTLLNSDRRAEYDAVLDWVESIPAAERPAAADGLPPLDPFNVCVCVNCREIRHWPGRPRVPRPPQILTDVFDTGRRPVLLGTYMGTGPAPAPAPNTEKRNSLAEAEESKISCTCAQAGEGKI